MNVTGTQTDARSHTHNSSITVTPSIGLHRTITELDCIACNSSRERQISQKCHLGVKQSLAASRFPPSPFPVTELQHHSGLHACQALAVLLIHTNCKSLSNVDFGVMTLVPVLAQTSRKPWLGELSETVLLCCDGSSVCHWGCQGNQGWGGG